jgi:NCAIR mutase (PurE)-related protein
MAFLVDERSLAELLDRVASGCTSANEAVGVLRSLPGESVADATLDAHRELRTGEAEAVFGPGKTPRQAGEIAAALVARASGAVFVTRASEEQARAVHEAVPEAAFHPRSGLIVAKAARRDPTLGTVAVVSAGTSDLPVAEEAAETLSALGVSVARIEDVGVAGLQRMLARRDDIEAAHCVIVVAGMEGALASVLAGLISKPVIAVPTSVGYGASFEGLAALLGMLSSCAPGISVVNIDNGFGAAHVARRILRAGRPRNG